MPTGNTLAIILMCVGAACLFYSVLGSSSDGSTTNEVDFASDDSLGRGQVLAGLVGLVCFFLGITLYTAAG